MQEHPGIFCLWNPESWGLESGKQLKESGILLKIGFKNPSFIDKEYVIQYSEFKPFLDSRAWGNYRNRQMSLVFPKFILPET